MRSRRGTNRNSSESYDQARAQAITEFRLRAQDAFTDWVDSLTGSGGPFNIDVEPDPADDPDGAALDELEGKLEPLLDDLRRAAAAAWHEAHRPAPKLRSVD